MKHGLFVLLLSAALTTFGQTTNAPGTRTVSGSTPTTNAPGGRTITYTVGTNTQAPSSMTTNAPGSRTLTNESDQANSPAFYFAPGDDSIKASTNAGLVRMYGTNMAHHLSNLQYDQGTIYSLVTANRTDGTLGSADDFIYTNQQWNVHSVLVAHAGISVTGVTEPRLRYRLGGTWRAFGDSIVYGTGASVLTNSFVSRISSLTGHAVNRYGLEGRELTEISWQPLPFATGGGDVSFLLTGYNDMRHHGINAAALTNYSDCLAHTIAWLAIPATNKVAGINMATNGVWTPTNSFNSTPYGVWSTNVGATITWTNYGSAVYVGWVCRKPVGDGGTFTINVDGVDRVTVDTSYGDNPALTEVTNWPALTRIGNLTNGAHTILVTVVSGRAQITWAAGNAGLNGPESPAVFCGGTLRMSAAGYATGEGYTSGSDAAVEQYNVINRALCTEFASDGLTVIQVDVGLHYTPEFNHLGQDLIHPGDAGHLAITRAFLESLENYSQPKARRL